MRPAPQYCRACTRVVLFCPECGKRLPLSGEQRFQGTVTVFCRHCRCGIEIALKVVIRPRKEPGPQDEPPCPEGESP
ncbi:MAG: hypothetical protein ACOC7Y_02180 [Chloroflexota bacterium]